MLKNLPFQQMLEVILKLLVQRPLSERKVNKMIFQVSFRLSVPETLASSVIL